MLDIPEVTAAELHRISGVMRTKTYETLDQMLAKGFCQERVAGNKRYFRAVQPLFLLETLKGQWNQECEDKVRVATSVFGDLHRHYQKQVHEKRNLDFIEILRRSDQIHQRYLDLNNEAKSEILAFNRSPYACLQTSVMKQQEDAEFEAIRRGVDSRAIYMAEEEHWHWLSPWIDQAVGVGQQAKVSNDLPMKLFIFDSKKVMFALPSIPGFALGDFTMVVIEDPLFTNSCKILFDTLWSASKRPEVWEGSGNGSRSKGRTLTSP